MTAKLAKKLGKLREEKKLAPTVVADQLGIHPIKLKSWERAKEIPDNDQLIKLADIYGVPAEELTSIVESDHEFGSSLWGRFPYPTIITVLYLCYGFYTHNWHPAWLVLLTVPIYRMIAEYFIGKHTQQ